MSNVILGLTLPIPVACAISIIIMWCKAYFQVKREDALEKQNPIVVLKPEEKTDECTDPV